MFAAAFLCKKLPTDFDALYARYQCREMNKTQLAAAVGKPKASRAVGGACHCNPIAILQPCHRVVGAKGRLTGYAGGLDKKVWLLQHEGVDLSQVTASGEWGSDESKMPETLQNPAL